MLSNILACSFLLVGALGLVSSPGTPDGLAVAMEPYFGHGCTLHSIELRLDKTDLTSLKANGVRIRNPKSLEVWSVVSGKRLAGYAFIDNVKGKVRQITYAVVFNLEGEIQGIEILKYRESHGGEVRGEMFRKQFAGKTVNDPLTLGRDIRNITGATISCRSVTGGVKSMAGLFEYLKQRGTLAAK